MKIRASELTGAALDWAVAKGEGDTDCVQFSALASSKHYFAPSKKWAQGGPIIEREGISLVQEGDSSPWVGSVYDYTAQDWHNHTPGPTPLIAAMRCYVASKLGEEVEVPDDIAA